MQTMFNSGRPKGLWGGTSIFFCLTLLSLMAVFFTLAEGVRILALNRSCDRITENSTNAVFSRFVDCLWTDYGILGVDMTCANQDDSGAMLSDYGLSYAEECGNPKTRTGTSYLRIKADSCQIKNYGLLTDQGGLPFLRMAAQTALEDLPEDLIDKAKEGVSGEEGQNAADSPDQLIEHGSQALEEIEKQKTKKNDDKKEELSQEEKDRREREKKKWKGVENPIGLAEKMRSKDILDLLMPKGKTVSDKKIDLSDRVSHRILQQGNQRTEGLSPVERGLYQQYAKKNLGFCLEPKEDGSLSYGSEYLIGGKDNDRDNLKETLMRILALREGQNFISLMKDPEKTALAESFAAVLSIFSGGSLEQAIKLAILAAWAFVESVMDLRALLSGEKIPILKSKSEWRSSLTNLGQSLSRGEKAKGSDHGLNYEAYLSIFLLALSTERLGLRSLDLIEADLSSRQGYESIRMDHLIYCADLEWNYYADPVFLSFVPSIQGKGELYDYKREKTFSYLT